MPSPCRKKTTKKYALRPGPPYPANEAGCRGRRKRGNDGKMYASEPDERGVHQWKQVARRSRSRTSPRRSPKSPRRSPKSPRRSRTSPRRSPKSPRRSPKSPRAKRIDRYSWGRPVKGPSVKDTALKQLLHDINVLLRTRNKMIERLVDIDLWDKHSLYMDAPPRAALMTFTQVKNVRDGKVALWIVQPQDYAKVSYLDHNNDHFQDDVGEGVGSFYSDRGRASTGYWWWIANPALKQWLEKINAKYVDILSRAS